MVPKNKKGKGTCHSPIGPTTHNRVNSQGYIPNDDNIPKMWTSEGELEPLGSLFGFQATLGNAQIPCGDGIQCSHMQRLCSLI